CQKQTHALQQESATRKRQPWQRRSRQSNIARWHRRRSRAGEISLYESSKAIRRGTMIGLVSMICSWGSPEKAAIEALGVGTIATLATDLWLWLLRKGG